MVWCCALIRPLGHRQKTSMPARMFRSFVLLGCVALVSSAAGVAFELNSNKVYLPVRVNGKGPYPFVLDTGSISNVVDAERAKLLCSSP